MFQRRKGNVIESSDGFSIRILGRIGLRYVEGARSIEVDSEVLVGHHGIVIYCYSLAQWEDGTMVDEASRERVIQNIEAALASQQITAVFR